MKITLKNGTEIEFEHFPIKESNQRKLRLHNKGGDSEGIWIALQDKDMEKYEKEYTGKDYETVAILLNNALNFYPNSSWGMYIPVKFRGEDRPECDISLIDFSNPPNFCEDALKQSSDEV
jgi:hypothetical protein